MLKRRASLLRFLCILGQAGVLVLGELGELLTDQSDGHKVNMRLLFLVTFYISLSTLPTTEQSCVAFLGMVN